MPHGVTDKVLGKLEWNDDHWETTASLEYFRGSGERLPLSEEDRAKLKPVDGLDLYVQSGDKRRTPDERQRAAWKKIVKRGEALWDEVLDALVAEYKRQRPLRVRYWKASGDSKLLARILPARIDRATMKKMVTPFWCTLEWPEPNEGAVDFSVTFDVTWYSECVNVYIRDGQVTDVTAAGSVHYRRRPAFQSKQFGTIRRDQNSAMPWCGTMEIEPYNTWAAVEVDRQHWDSDHTPDVRSSLPFRAERTEVFIYSPRNKPPTPRQEAAFREATSAPATREVIGALFEHYRQVADERRKTYQGPNGNAAVPRLKCPDGLCDVTELHRLHIFPDDGPGPIAVGFEFHGSWTGCEGFLGNDGCGIRWRDGKIERIGDPRLADPDRYKKAEKP